MRHRVTLAGIALVALALLPHPARANARLVAVTPVDGGCVNGPTGQYVEAWDVAVGSTYRLRLEGVTDCANGGTDATVNVLVLNSSGGNTPLVAQWVADGTYEFTFAVPTTYCDTSPILYCTAGGNSPSTGLVVGRHDTGLYQSHLRASEFYGSCSNPVTIHCVTPTLRTTWGELKTIYR